MCVIVVKERGQEIPENSILKECFEHNSDGAGFAFVRDGRVEIRKGFMTWRRFRGVLRKEMLKKSDTVMYHFRISTSGGIMPENTHPFPVTTSEHTLGKRKVSTLCAVAHNGIISSNGEGMKSDTFVFVRDVLSVKQIRDAIRHPTFQSHFLPSHG